MENRMQIISNECFGDVRVKMIDGEPWFVGKDVCAAFGDTNYRRSLRRLDASEKGVSQIETGGGKQSMTVVNEPGLYALLLTMEPKKARGVSQNSELIEARIRLLDEFKRWITHDVLPCIRKYGCYITPKKLREIENEPNELYRIALLLAAKREAVPAWTLPDQDVKDVSGRILEENRSAYEYLVEEALDMDDMKSLWNPDNE